jgi:hypothetical protein
MTKNIFRDIQSAEEIEGILRRHPRRPLLPPLGSEPWQHAQQNPHVRTLTAWLRERALREGSEALPILTDELYASFKATGRRIAFESVYFERRRRLARAAVALLLETPGSSACAPLASSVVEKFTDIFQEVSWALPAHVNWHNDDVSGKEPMRIDLFCAETANLMAEMLDLFGDIIPVQLQAQIRGRLTTHVWENYEQNFNDLHWTQATHNWNAVCHQGVLGSALSQTEDFGLLARMLWLARKSLPLFLGGFTPDGGCTEGVGYWSYGFGWFAILNEQLETRTGGELSLVEGDEHVRRIARFGPRMSLEGAQLVNFSDNGAEGSLSGPLVAYLGERLDEPDCQREAMKSYRLLIKTGIKPDAERCDVFYLGRLLLRCPGKISEGGEASAADGLLPDLAVLVAHGRDDRGRVWDFAAKAGHNDEHHNHNDCGSFLCNVAGIRFVAEIGAPEYTKEFFSPARYENLAARSLGHSVPRINGWEQAAGPAYKSSIVSHTLEKTTVEFVVDATASYPAEAGCRKFVRAFRFEKTGGLRLQDSFELERFDSLESALIAIHPIIIEKDRAFIRAGGLEMVVRPLAGTRLDRVEVHRYSSRGGHEASIHRLVLVPEAPARSCSLGVDFSLSG